MDVCMVWGIHSICIHFSAKRALNPNLSVSLSLSLCLCLCLCLSVQSMNTSPRREGKAWRNPKKRKRKIIYPSSFIIIIIIIVFFFFFFFFFFFNHQSNLCTISCFRDLSCSHSVSLPPSSSSFFLCFFIRPLVSSSSYCRIGFHYADLYFLHPFAPSIH